jgi:DNA-binding response OmpR family regulator
MHQNKVPNSASVDNLKGKHVLIVEDNPFLADIFTRMVMHWGIRVSTADSGDEALRIADRLNPDLILLDLCLPDIDGLEVATQLRCSRKTQSLPILAISGSFQSREKCLKNGCNDFLLKPFHAAELLTRISRLSTSENC